jgi:hypothetical protein
MSFCMQFLAFRKTILPPSSVSSTVGILKMEAIYSYETSMTIHQSTCRIINLHSTTLRALNLGNKDRMGSLVPQAD